MCKGSILVVDDVPDMRMTLSGLLSDEGYDVCSVSSRAEALQVMETEHFDVAVLDVRLDETDEDNREGLLLMHEIGAKDPNTAVIILTGYADIKMVREALEPNHSGKSLAHCFLEKSEIDQLPDRVRRAFDTIPSVSRLIAQGEGNCVEFKSSIRWDYRRKSANKQLEEAIAQAIAGMLNSEGGVLLIGVADNGTVIGIEQDLQALNRKNLDGFELTLTDIVNDFLGIECMAYIKTYFEIVEDKHICVVSIQKSPAPVYVKQGNELKLWVRLGNSTRNLNVKAAIDYIRSHW